MKTKPLTQPTLFNPDAFAIPQASGLETHPDAVDMEGDDAESSVPSDWEQLRQSQQKCAEIRERIHAVYADAKAEGFERRLPVEYERAIRALNGEIIAELERTKELRTKRHNYRGWTGEIYIAESKTRIRAVDPDGWLSFDELIPGTAKAVGMLKLMELIDAAIEQLEKERSPLIDADSLTPNPEPVSESNLELDSLTPNPEPVSESNLELDSLTPNPEPVSESTQCVTESTETQAQVSPSQVRVSPTQENDSLTCIHAVSESSAEQKYAPKGTARTTNAYFRYSYKEWGKTKHCHIPGGNTLSAIAQRNWARVQELKAKGWNPSDIAAEIQSWK